MTNTQQLDPTEHLDTVIMPASETKPLRIDLACGQVPKEGFEGVDLLATGPGIRKVDLTKFPWPFEDNSVDALYCSHFIEHIPSREIEERDLVRGTLECGTGGLGNILPKGEKGVYLLQNAVHPADVERFVGQDMLFAFFDECWRILKHGGTMRVIWPSLQTVRAFQDPTHRRYIPFDFLHYLHAPWRKAVQLDHYRVRCNYLFSGAPTIPNHVAERSMEVQERLFREAWNCTHDFVADLAAIKTDAPVEQPKVPNSF